MELVSDTVTEQDPVLSWYSAFNMLWLCFWTGVDVKTGDVYPASFPHKGPAEELRSARTFTGGEVLCKHDMMRFFLREKCMFGYTQFSVVYLIFNQSVNFERDPQITSSLIFFFFLTSSTYWSDLKMFSQVCVLMDNGSGILKLLLFLCLVFVFCWQKTETYKLK